MPNAIVMRFVNMVQQAINNGTYTTLIGLNAVVFTYSSKAKAVTYQINGTAATQWQVIALLTQYPTS